MPPRLHKIAAQALEPCSPPHAFRFADGREARHLHDLRATLEQADDGLVEHHRDHFHHWIRDVAGDLKLARAFRETGESDRYRGADLRERLLKHLDARMKEYAGAPKGTSRQRNT